MIKVISKYWLMRCYRLIPGILKSQINLRCDRVSLMSSMALCHANEWLQYNQQHLDAFSGSDTNVFRVPTSATWFWVMAITCSGHQCHRYHSTAGRYATFGMSRKDSDLQTAVTAWRSHRIIVPWHTNVSKDLLRKLTVEEQRVTPAKRLRQ